MLVKVFDYGIKEFEDSESLNYVKYKVSGLDSNYQKKLIEKLEEETEIIADDLIITVLYKKEYFPFGSDEATVKIDDFIARDEIEMTVFLSSLLEED